MEQNTKYVHRIALLITMVGITKPQAWISSIDPGGHFQVSQVGQSLVFNTVRK